MSRLKARAASKRRQSQQAETSLWPDLCHRINAGEVIPIVSNALFNEPIFDMDGDGIVGISDGEENPKRWSIEEQLADAWAEEIGYPFAQGNELARVALFDRVVNSHDDRQAKRRYLNWLKDALLYLATDDEQVDPELIEELREDSKQYSFSDIAVSLGYPRAVTQEDGPLQLLARFNLPVYITTSPFDFLERAIRAGHREPRTQVCFWSEEPVVYEDESHQTDYNFVPSPETPLVYHIFGLEAYPESMVLTEADYLDFLTVLSADTSAEQPLLPLYLRKALTQSSLILLGYRLRDWDFRVIFRGIIQATQSSLRMFNLAIQLDPKQQGLDVSAEKIRTYLEKYFDSSHFTVEWDEPYSFIRTLWKEWDQWRR